MSSRVFLLLGLLAAFVLLFASDVAARDLAEKTTTSTANGVNDAKYRGGGYGGYPGSGYGGDRGGYGGSGRGGYDGGRVQCSYGCCSGGSSVRCSCCASAAEAAQKAAEVKPQN